MGDGDTLVNALIGGLVAMVASAIPFGTVIGGMVAGYLQGGSRRDGTVVGAYAGVVAAIPMALFGGFFMLLLFGYGITAGARAGLSILLVFTLVFVVSAFYSVGLCALGGYLGNYVRYDTDLLD